MNGLLLARNGFSELSATVDRRADEMWITWILMKNKIIFSFKNVVVNV